MTKELYPVIGKQTSLPMYLTGIGTLDHQYHIDRRDGLASHQILYTECGSGILHINGVNFRIDEGSLFYISPGVPHEYYSENGKWTTCWLVFRGKCLAEILREMGFGEYFICEKPDIKLLKKLFRMIFSAAADPVCGAEKSSLLLYEYVLETRKLFAPELSPVSSDNVVSEAVAFIDANYMEEITLDMLCERTGFSRQHFCRLFKAGTGMRPVEYIARRRIAQAKTLLANSELSVSETGAAVGYSDLTYFGMVFRKYEGISPGEYRKRRSSLAI